MIIEKIKEKDNLSQSANIVENNINKLKALFPEIVTEGRIDFKVLQQVLGEELEEEEEYYRFTWAGKSQARREAHKPSTGTLRPAKEESLDWDTTENMYIEGDNLEVLKLLQKSYAGKIKMIYIDPPYNTGKDFVYKDNYKDNLKNYQEVTGQIDSDGNKISTNSDSDGRYHSNWLNMMYPRLRLARNLLKEDGVIVVSIDDNEVDNLKKIMNEIYGEENLINCISVEMSNMSGPKVQHAITGKKFPKLKEYNLLYCKNKNNYNLSIPRFKKEKWDNEYNLIIPQFSNELIRLIENSNDVNELNRIVKDYDIFSLNQFMRENNISDELKFKQENSFRIFASKPNTALLKSNRHMIFEQNLYFVKNSSGQVKLIKTDFNRDTKTARIELVSSKDNSEVFFGDSWRDIVTTGGIGSEGYVTYKNAKKPLKLVNRFIETICNNDDYILDFFSGSGTTGHATLNFNSKNNTNLKYILVQLNENLEKSFKESTDSSTKSQLQEMIDFLQEIDKPKYLSEIGKERMRRVSKKIKDEIPENPKYINLGFKVFKLDSSNIKSWDGNPENLETSLFDAVGNIKTDRTEEDVLYEILLKYGLDLTLPIEERIIEGKKVFNVGLGALFICLSDNITAKVAEGIGQWKESCSPEICRVIFKDNGFTDVEKTNSVQTLKRYGINEIRSI